MDMRENDSQSFVSSAILWLHLEMKLFNDEDYLFPACNGLLY